MSSPPALRVALLGFSPAENTAFSSFFRLAARRSPGYEMVTDAAGAAEAAIIVANADHPRTMDWLLDHPPAVPVLLIGASDADTGWPLEPRPIKLMGVLSAVDRLLGFVPASPVPAATRQAEAVRLPVARAPGGAPAPSPVPPATTPTTDVSPTRSPPRTDATTQPAQRNDDGLLLVSTDAPALEALAALLARVGFGCAMVRSGAEALALLAARPWRLVFLDVALADMDGWQACKAIKQAGQQGRSPAVVMLSARATDKFKGSLAGCDEYLAKPVDDKALLKLLAKYEANIPRSFQATRHSRQHR